MVVRSMVKSEQTGGTGHREGTKATTLLPAGNCPSHLGDMQAVLSHSTPLKTSFLSCRAYRSGTLLTSKWFVSGNNGPIISQVLAY